jgi:hypothetical protein
MSDLHELVAQLRHLDASAGEIATAISKRSDGYPSNLPNRTGPMRR